MEAAERATGAGGKRSKRDRNWPEVGLQVMEALGRALGEVNARKLILHTTGLWSGRGVGKRRVRVVER